MALLRAPRLHRGATGAEVASVAQAPTSSRQAALLAVRADQHRIEEAIDAGVHKIRLNPGNLKDRPKVEKVIAACKERKIPIRVGANEGGGLLPTLAFGIPGGESMALLLIAFAVALSALNILPQERMGEEQLRQRGGWLGLRRRRRFHRQLRHRRCGCRRCGGFSPGLLRP